MSSTNNQEPEKDDKIAEQSELDHEVQEPEIKVKNVDRVESSLNGEEQESEIKVKNVKLVGFPLFP